MTMEYWYEAHEHAIDLRGQHVATPYHRFWWEKKNKGAVRRPWAFNSGCLHFLWVSYCTYFEYQWSRRRENVLKFSNLHTLWSTLLLKQLPSKLSSIECSQNNFLNLIEPIIACILNKSLKCQIRRLYKLADANEPDQQVGAVLFAKCFLIVLRTQDDPKVYYAHSNHLPSCFFHNTTIVDNK